jgi:hypothetical protein
MRLSLEQARKSRSTHAALSTTEVVPEVFSSTSKEGAKKQLTVQLDL